MPKKVPNTKALREAKAEYDEYLRKLGFDPSKKPQVKKKGLWKPEKSNDRGVPASDRVPGNGTRKDRETPETGLMVAQVYAKGPLMVVGSAKELVGSKRRS